MKCLEAKEGKCLRSRGDKQAGRFHRADVPGALMKDFRGVARAVSWLGLLQEKPALRMQTRQYLRQHSDPRHPHKGTWEMR